MITKITWALDSAGQPNLEIEFSPTEERFTFLTNAIMAFSKLGLNFPIVAYNDKTLRIGASNYPSNLCGCYISPGGKLAINFGEVPFLNYLLAQLKVTGEHAEIPEGHNTIFFHPSKLPAPHASLTLSQPVSPVPLVAPQSEPQKVVSAFAALSLSSAAGTMFAPSTPAAQLITQVDLKAVGTSDAIKLELTFQKAQELHQFINKVKDLGSALPFYIVWPNKVVLGSSNYPAQPLGCYLSKSKEIAVNFGSMKHRDIILNLLGIPENFGYKPAQDEVGNGTIYFDTLKLSLNGPTVSVGQTDNEPMDYLDTAKGKKTAKDVSTKFLLIPYNLELIEPKTMAIKTAWEKHADWEHWTNMGEDWSIYTPVGEVQRPNHGVAHTLRVAKLVPVVAEFLKAYGHKKFASLTKKDIHKAQHMMLFSVIGRENEMSWTDANHYQEATFEVTHIKPEHLYSKFKKNAEKGFLDHVKENEADLIPSLFSNKSEIHHWAEALDTGKPGITTITGLLMALAHDLDLMRCYDRDKFNKFKMSDIINILGGNKEAAIKLVEYVRALIIATGDRCMGYGPDKDYNLTLFGQCSLDPDVCLDKIKSVVIPSALPVEQSAIFHM